jgi:hypothetical protein
MAWRSIALKYRWNEAMDARTSIGSGSGLVRSSSQRSQLNDGSVKVSIVRDLERFVKRSGSPGVPVGLSGAGNGENPFDH